MSTTLSELRMVKLQPQNVLTVVMRLTGEGEDDGQAPTRKASLNSNRQGNCLSSWWTQSSHCRKTGHCSLTSSAFSWWPQRSPNLWPKSSHSVSTSTWKPWGRQSDQSEKQWFIAAGLWYRDLLGYKSPVSSLRLFCLQYPRCTSNLTSHSESFFHRYFKALIFTDKLNFINLNSSLLIENWYFPFSVLFLTRNTWAVVKLNTCLCLRSACSRAVLVSVRLWEKQR